MTPIFLYDDTVRVPEHAAALTGVDSFGVLLHRKRRLADIALEAARQAGLGERIHLRADADLREVAARAAEAGQDARWVYLPANLAAADPAALPGLLAKLAFVDGAVVLRADGKSSGGALAALPTHLLASLVNALRRGRRDFFLEAPERFEEIPNRPRLVDIAEPRAFIAFLTGTFSTRAFNEIRHDDLVVEKSSSDRVKMRREHAYWGLLPEAMKRWFVQPYDFKETAAGASYKMERLAIPDMAIQWVHDAASLEEFGRFLDRATRFLAERPRKDAARADLDRVVWNLHVEKLEQRLEAFARTPEARRVDAALAAGVPGAPLAGLLSRQKDLLARVKRDFSRPELVIGHGDFCLSNILYDKRTGMMKLIDPRGAETESELWTDPYYDAAKLSHSILGGYDFVNSGLFEVRYGDGLRLEIALEQPNLAERQDLFRSRLKDAGFDLRLVRVYEAGLFLSMLPLHAEEPLKVLGFALLARDIQDELETGQKIGGGIPAFGRRARAKA